MQREQLLIVALNLVIKTEMVNMRRGLTGK